MKANLNLSESRKNGRNGNQFIYILDGIKYSTAVTDEGKTFANDREIIEYFFSRFDSDGNSAYNKHVFPNLTDRLEDWLRGLPSVISLKYSNYDIEKLFISWGLLKGENDKRAEKLVADYWHVLSVRIIQLAQILGVNTYKYI